jgi:RND family efflux transporter MFP subunit
MPRGLDRAVPLLLLLAASGMGGCGGDRPATASPGRDRAAARPREVRVVPAALERVPRSVIVTGTLAADEQIVLSLKVAGRLAELGVDLGSPVRRGQVLARLDPTDFELRVRQAEAALHQARARLGLPPQGDDDRVDPESTAVVRQARAVLHEARLTRDRMERLWSQQLVARAQVDAAVAALQVAEGRYQDALEEVRNRQAVLAQRRTELALARQQLADTVLAAPTDGMIRERRASVGEFLAAGTPVATLVKVHPLRLVLAVPERAATGLRPGLTVRVTVEGDPAVHTGWVARLAPSFQEQTRTLTVETEVPNERGALRPGAFARAEIVTAAAEPVVFVPASAVVTFAGIEKVLTVREGRAVEVRIATGRRDGGRVEVTEGLQGGEAVVVEPGNLVGGQPVTVVRP